MLSSKAALRTILGLEERGAWNAVEKRSLVLVRAINEGRANDVPVEAYRFIEDSDVRQKSERYAEDQREKLREYLNS